jgi:hypothetical protein
MNLARIREWLLAPGAVPYHVADTPSRAYDWCMREPFVDGNLSGWLQRAPRSRRARRSIVLGSMPAKAESTSGTSGARTGKRAQK